MGWRRIILLIAGGAKEGNWTRESDDVKSAFRQSASFSALKLLLRELAEHSGVQEGRFDMVFEEATKVILSNLLLRASEFHKASAALLDDRKNDEIATEDQIPRLFPDS